MSWKALLYITIIITIVIIVISIIQKPTCFAAPVLLLLLLDLFLKWAAAPCTGYGLAH